MRNVSLLRKIKCICVFVFVMMAREITSQLLPTHNPSINNSGGFGGGLPPPVSVKQPETTTQSLKSNFNLTSQIQEEDYTTDQILSLVSSTPDFSEREEEEEEEEDKDDSTLPPDIILPTTLGPHDPVRQPETTTTSTFMSPEISTRNPRTSHCPVIGVEELPGSLVKCQCKGNEVLHVDGHCHNYTKGTITIPTLVDFVNDITQEVPVTNYQVIVRDVKCDPGKGRLLNFTKEQFQLRFRGDLVLLMSAGDLDGQRISNYCVTHHLDEHDDLKVMVKVCVPVPAVPRCCPAGQAMKDGSCQPANTPDFLTPPIGAKPFHHSIEWPNITNFLSPLTCTNDPVKTIPLSYRASHVVSLAHGLQNTWVPAVIKEEAIYYSCPNYCVDGIENPDGSVSYFTSFCYTRSNPIEHHEKVCDGRPCLRKCCKWGQVMDGNYFGCAPVSNPIFNPSTVTNVSSYNIVIGWPICTSTLQTNGIINIDESGILIYEGRKFPSTDYCVDTFVKDDASEQGALTCLVLNSLVLNTLWQDVRPFLFPICQIISLFFLTINIGCHLMVPKLLENGGVHQLCHSIALSIGYLSSIILHVSYVNLNSMICFHNGIMMQFGYLTTFFWLNVMCFEIWRKIRQLKIFQPCKPYPIWYYMLYAWGIPSLICITTVGMELWAPENVAGLIKPNIECWFTEDIALFVYFYGPIAAVVVSNIIFLGLTYYNYKHLMKNYKETTKCLREMGSRNASVSSPPKSTSRLPSKQLTDHVHEFKQKLQLFVLMALCWVTEILSWKIPPPEIWALTDTLNVLQGFFIFIILLCNRNKHKQLEEKFPRPFKMAHKCMEIPSKIKRWLYTDGIFPTPVESITSTSPMNSSTSAMSRNLSNSTLVSSFISSFNYSSNSASSLGAPSVKSPTSMALDDSENGVIIH